jgi:N-acetylglucosaminyldiphosphoundecaprenol N-acetyl-beta-D-mannosaminyltransferase
MNAQRSILSNEALENTAAEPLASRSILGMRVDATSYEHATAVVLDWSRRKQSRYVCASSVNNVMEAHDNVAFRDVMNAADLVTPDGMPLVWGLKLQGCRTASRVYGPTLTELLCERAAVESVPVGFYGGTEGVLTKLVDELHARWPNLAIPYVWSPPFRALTALEDQEVVDRINSSGALIVFVGLGTPKQDVWMAEHKNRIGAVMLGVGAAFNFIAGEKKQSPRWLQALGLEWLFRLACEPRRLWKRYLLRNPRFLALFARQLFKSKLSTLVGSRTKKQGSIHDEARSRGRSR